MNVGKNFVESNERIIRFFITSYFVILKPLSKVKLKSKFWLTNSVIVILSNTLVAPLCPKISLKTTIGNVQLTLTSYQEQLLGIASSFLSIYFVSNVVYCKLVREGVLYNIIS